MIDVLIEAGLDGKDIRIIVELYWNQKAAIKVENELSEHTEIKRGVRQGCVLSLYLFNIYTEYIFRNAKDIPGVNIQGYNLNNIRYVDDTTLLASNHTDLQKLFNCVKAVSSTKGLEMNISKTKTMVIRKEDGKSVNIVSDDTVLDQVHHFKYLGQALCKRVL